MCASFFVLLPPAIVSLLILLLLWERWRLFRASKAQAKLTLELSAERDRWRLAQFANNDGLFDWNLRSGEHFYSPRWGEMLGLQAHELRNDEASWRERIHPDDLERVANALADYLAAESAAAFDIEYRLRHRDGSWRWVLTRARGTWDKEGRALRLVGSNADITHHRNTEAKRGEAIQASAAICHSPPITPAGS